MKPWPIAVRLLSTSVLAALLVTCGGKSSTGATTTVEKANYPPTVSAPTWTPADNPLVRYKTYTLSATATDPDIGDTIARYEWDFGDGSAAVTTTTGSTTHSYGTSGSFSVKVRATDNRGLAGSYTEKSLTVQDSASPISVTVVKPTVPTTLKGQTGTTVTLSAGISVVSSLSAAITASGITVNPGESTPKDPLIVDNGNGTFSIDIVYALGNVADATGRVVNPTVRVADSNGVQSDLVTLPAVTLIPEGSAAPVVSVVAPGDSSIFKVQVGQTVRVDYLLSITNPNGTGPLPVTAITFDPGEPTATVEKPLISHGDGTYTVRATYLAAVAPGTRTITPLISVTDSKGVSATPDKVPTVTLQTTSTANTAPMLTIGSTPEIPAGANATWQGVKVKFAGVMSDVDKDPLSYQVSFGDSGTGDIDWTPSVGGTLPELSHTFATPGVYPVTLRVDDGHVNGQKSMTLSLNVLANGAPTLAIASLPASNPYAYQPVSFTATTTDPESDPVTVTWDFGDLSPQASGASVVHTFTAVVPTTVTATARDGKGGVTVQTYLVNVVANQPSTAGVLTKPTDLEPSGILLQNKTYSFNATGVPTTGNSIASYEWSFGDGTAIQAGNPVTHAFQPPFQGAASVKVRVIDSKGSVGDWSPAVVFTVQATQMPVVSFLVPAATANFNTETGAAGVTTTYVVRVTNPNGSGFLPASALYFDAGEATATVLSKVSNGDGTYTLSVRYVPGTAGASRNLNASAYAVDASGIRGLTVNGPVLSVTTQAANRPPVVTLSSSPAIAAGTNATYQNVQVTFTATATDPDSDALTYSWNFGDGTTLSGLTEASALVQTHTYATAGAYPVSVMADDGRTAGTKTAMLTMNILANTPPTFTANASSLTPYAYQRVTFTATGLTPSTATVTWNFGDGTSTATGASVIHQFQAAVPTTVTAVADDGKGGITTKTLTVNVQANTPPVASVTTASATLYQNKNYTFTATGTATTGNTVASYEWDFGDNTGVVAGTNNQAHTYAATVTGPVSVKVRAIDTKGSVGDWSPAVTFTIQATGLPVVTFVSPAAPVALSVETGGTVDYTFRIHATNPRAGQPGVTDPIPVDHLSFDWGDGTLAAVQGSITSVGGGDYTVKVRYQPATAPGVRTAVPSAAARDTLEIQGLSASGPAVTVTTRSTNTAPSVYVSTPASPSSNAFTTKPVDFVFTLTDADGDPVTYTVDWGDGATGTTTEFTGTPTGDFKAGVQVTVSHAYADALAGSTRTVTVTATDGHSLSGTALPRTRTITLLANAKPTATITLPQTSAITAGTSLTATDSTADILIIPAGGKVRFAGSATAPSSGGALTYAWSFPGGVPSSSTAQNPGEVTFTGDPNSVQAYLVTFTATDPWARSSDNTVKASRKWIVVDGPNTQYFNLAFMYRLKGDNFIFNNLSPAKTAANGLGAAVQLFQDGVASTWTIQDLANTAQAQIPVRANLSSFYVNIPNFGTDTLNYMMEIPNQPGQDPTLEVSLPGGSSAFRFKNGTATAAPWWGPTLTLVTAQGYAPESETSPEKRITADTWVGAVPGWWEDTSTAPKLAFNRWIDRLSMPLGDPTAVTPALPNGNFILSRALQGVAEWVSVVRTRDLKPPAVNADQWSLKGQDASHQTFVMDWSTFCVPKAPSLVSPMDRLQAFRVPGNSTDPYDLEAAGWDSAVVRFAQADDAPVSDDLDASLNKLGASVRSAWNDWIYQPLGSGGLGNIGLPFDYNDPNWVPQAAPVLSFSAGESGFAYSEYLWSSVWARPLVLNRANLGVYHAVNTFPRFYYSVPNGTVWPAKSGISPDNSAFDMTPGAAGTFDNSAPFTVNAAPPVAGKGVARFYWTAFVPGNMLPTTGGSGLSRTWLAGKAGAATTVDNQPPDSNYAPSGAGIAQARFGLVPPMGVRLDERERDAKGVLTGNTLGGYRINWYNANRDNAGNVVAPDFWVVEFADNGAKTHFLLPAAYPAPANYPAYDPYNPTAPNKGLPFLTDAQTYLPSKAATLQVGDTIAPGYCWFDVPLELRPAIPPSSTSTITVFGLKSIARADSLVTARPLNRTEWIDAIKTATAQVTFKSNNGVDYGYVHKIPFNYAWDIVVVQSVAAPVAR